MTHSPAYEVDFEALVTCPGCDEVTDVHFYACACCNTGDGTCPECGEDVHWEQVREGAREYA